MRTLTDFKPMCSFGVLVQTAEDFCAPQEGHVCKPVMVGIRPRKTAQDELWYITPITSAFQMGGYKAYLYACKN